MSAPLFAERVRSALELAVLDTAGALPDQLGITVEFDAELRLCRVTVPAWLWSARLATALRAAPGRMLDRQRWALIVVST